jgi:predicted nucleotidyltransferase
MKELNKVLYIANSFLDELGEGEIDAVYLIGSHASDKAREQSDIDFLVVGDGFDLVEEERLERAEEGNPFPGLDVSIAPGDVDITFSSNHPREDQPHKKLYPKKINELDQLVENFFQPKRDTLGLDQLVEMVEELMGEATKEGLGEIAKEIVKILQAEDTSDDAVAFINLGDIKIKGTPTSKTIAITNTGDRKTRTKLYTKLDNDQNYTVKIVRRQKSGSDEEFAPRGEVTKDGIAFTLDFYKGSTPKTISNIGNFAEGVTAYAIAAKLANPSQEVSLDDTIRVATNVERSSDGEGKKREIRKDFKVDLPDDNTLDLALGLDKKTFEDLDNPKKWSFADDTVSAALSLVNGEDFVEFISNTSNHTFIINADGVSDQKGSKADIQIQKKNNETGELQGFLNKDGKVSLKTKSTKQLHQTGKDFLKMAEIFENLFGFRIISNNISKKDIKKINNWLKQVDRESSLRQRWFL